jgi:hypothetical protein
MRRITAFALGLLLLAGCESINIRRPFQRQTPEKVDDPLLPVSEQQRRGRDRFAYPDESSTVAPPTFTGPRATPTIKES